MKQLALPIVPEPSDCFEFLVSSCNENAYISLIEKFSYILHNRVIINGPSMCGKTRLAKLWCQDDFYINCENAQLDFHIATNQSRFVIDNFHLADEIELFHTINRCSNRKINLLLVAGAKHNFKLPDLISRLNASCKLFISSPDNDFCLLVIQELCFMNKIKLRNNTLSYIKEHINFNTFPNLWRFRVELKIACDNNGMALDIDTFKKVYDNWRRL